MRHSNAYARVVGLFLLNGGNVANNAYAQKGGVLLMQNNGVIRKTLMPKILESCILTIARQLKARLMRIMAE